MQPRRAQQPITIRSDRAAARLALLTRGGRSQAQVIEDALDRLPVPPAPNVDADAAMIRIREIQAMFRAEPRRYASMAQFDAAEYDEDGNPR